MNLAYVIIGIVMFLIALTAALWAYSVANDCKSLSRAIGQLTTKYTLFQEQCLPDIQHEAVELLIISVIIYSIIGIVSIIGGFKSKRSDVKEVIEK